MRNKLTRILLSTLFGALVFTVGSMMIVSGQDKGASHLRNLVGTWKTAVSPANCETGTPLPVPPFPGILTFNQGGTMTGTSSAVSSTFGIWQNKRGWTDYSFTALSFRYDGSGNILGTRTIKQNVTLVSGGMEITASGQFTDTDTNGGVVATGCTTATGKRVE